MRKNDFAYFDKKPFEECYTDKQQFGILKETEEGIEITVNSIEIFDPFDMNIGSIYAIDYKLTPITLFYVKTGTTTFSALSSTTIKSSYYAIGSTNLNEEGKISHLTDDSLINKLYYYNNDLNEMFNKGNLKSERKFDEKYNIENLKIQADRIKEKLIGNIETDSGNIKIYIDSKVEYSYISNKMSAGISTKIILEFENEIVIKDVKKYIKIIDATIKMLTGNSTRCSSIGVVSEDNYYSVVDKNYNKEKYTIGNNENIIKENIEENFLKIMRKLIEFYEDENFKNIITNFIYDRSNISAEIQFLEYYRTLEYLDFKRQMEKGKGKRSDFINYYIEKYIKIVESLFKYENNTEVSNNMRSLRNYYSHEGYFFRGLPVPERKPKRTRLNKNCFKLEMYRLIKAIVHLEIYEECDVKIKNIQKLLNV